MKEIRYFSQLIVVCILAAVCTLLLFYLCPGEDFTDTPISITIPANREAFDIPAFFNISADNIDEYEQSFALVAEIGQDVPENTSCFQSAVSLGCFGRRGATEIRITDIDRKLYVLTKINMILPLFFRLSHDHWIHGENSDNIRS